jgi:hypothetical protein
MEFDVNNDRDIIAQYKSGAKNFSMRADGFLYSTSGWARRHVVIGLGDVAANSDVYTYPLLRAKHDITIESVDIAVDTTLAADASHYETVYLENSGSTTDISTMATAAGLTVKVPSAFSSLDSTAKIIRAGNTLQLRFAKTGNGGALSGVVVSISFSINEALGSVGEATDNVFYIVNDIGTAAVIASDHTSHDHLVVKRKGVESFRVDLNGIMKGSAPDQYYYIAANVGTIVAADGAAKKCVLTKPHAEIEVQDIYIGAISDCDADSDTAFMQVLLKDNSGNVLASNYIHGPYGGGLELDKGKLYRLGEINAEYAKITSSEQLQLEFVATGSPSDIPGLTAVLVYKKVA